MRPLTARIDPEELLLAYRLGIFPMAESRTAKHVLWIRPSERGILPLDKFRVPKRLARTVRTDRFDVRTDTAFGDVVRACAASTPGRRETWINDPIIEVFEELFRRGMAHSVECWRDGDLVGGTYGLAMGAAFFAESKFSRATDASKVALVHLAARLKLGNFRLLDAQFPNPHLEQFGAVAVPELKFEGLLAEALTRDAQWVGSVPTPTSSSGSSGGSSVGVSTAPGAGMTSVAPGSAGARGRACAAVTTGGAGGGGAGSSVMQVITQTS